MGQLSPILRNAEGGRLHFWCPGCNEVHGIRIKVDESTHHPCWGWDGDVNKPTFTPSILCTGRRFTEKGEADYQAWYAAGCSTPAPNFDSVDSVCHSYVTDGNIQFLGDCTHKLAGQTVPLPEWE